jgi:ABC-2 type transport system permease protein
MIMPLFKVLTTLLQRELREHRLLFLYLPAACALLACAGFALWLVLASGPPETFLRFAETPPRQLTPEQAQAYLRQMREIKETWHSDTASEIYQGAEGLMLLTFWASMAFYYLNTLYQSRKDRSILFWHSLPVSDAQTIASKLLAGLVGCQLVYMLCFAVLDLFMRLATQIWVGSNDIEGFTAYLRDTGPFANALVSLSMMPVNLLWCLPAYAGLLLASAWSREAPFAWATGPWVVVILAEVVLTERSLVFNKLFEHLLPMEFFKLNNGPYPAPELALSALLGAALVYAAVRLNRSHDN